MNTLFKLENWSSGIKQDKNGRVFYCPFPWTRSAFAIPSKERENQIRFGQFLYRVFCLVVSVTGALIGLAVDHLGIFLIVIAANVLGVYFWLVHRWTSSLTKVDDKNSPTTVEGNWLFRFMNNYRLPGILVLSALSLYLVARLFKRFHDADFFLDELPPFVSIVALVRLFLMRPRV